MTREEAINILSKVTLAYEIGKVTITQREINEALDMAIKALERESCGDCISRQAAIDAFEDTTFTKKEILRRLLELPLVTLQPCEDAVSRAEVLKLMKDNWHTHSGDWAMQESIDDIRAMLSVIPQTKVGQWILSGGYWRCSECKEKALLKLDKAKGNCKEYMPIKSEYCPNCGARMVEVKE